MQRELTGAPGRVHAAIGSLFNMRAVAVAALLLAAQFLAPPAAQAEIFQETNKKVGSDALPASQQGFASAISGDGTTAIVGGWDDAGTGSGSDGAFWIYTRSGSTWSQQGPKLIGTGVTVDGNGNGAQQGYSVAISQDGNTVAVGGPDDNNGVGAVWIFTRSAGAWTQQQKLVGSNPVGHSQQGFSVALSRDGDTVIFGGPADNGFAGATWVFVRNPNDGTWAQQGDKLIGIPTANGDRGESVALSADGNTALVGGNGRSAAFTRSGGIWTQQSEDWTTIIAEGAALSDDGNTAALGDPFLDGGVWIYTRSGTVWSADPTFLQGDNAVGGSQGERIALSADGNTLLSSSPSDNSGIGTFWIFTRTGGTWSQFLSKIPVPPDANDQGNGIIGFGASVGISADGNRIIAGANEDYHPDDGTLGAVWMFAQSPTVLSVTPDKGPLAGGNTVTINGVGFTGVNTSTGVTFDGVAATEIVVVDPSHITAKPPAHAAGAVEVSVTNSVSTTSLIGGYTYLTAPDVTNVLPISGPAAGNAPASIVGTNFTGVTSVTFGGTPVTSFTFINDGQIDVVTPAHAAGSVAVAVTTPGGTDALSSAYIFATTPAVTGVSPNSGYTTGGITVTITGSDFDFGGSVKFGGTDATSFTVDSTTQITAVAPAHAAGQVFVVVSTQGGNSVTGDASKFTYLAAPTRTTLHTFKGGKKDGGFPTGALVQDKSGNLYGVTSIGGTKNNGTVFMLAAPDLTTRTVLHSFAGGTKDGAMPRVGLLIDKKGLLYGATEMGGPGDTGVVFRLTPPAPTDQRLLQGSAWTYDVLYAFKNEADGSEPRSLVLDKKGNIYGATAIGGSATLGTLFKLTAGKTVPWAKTALHDFAGGKKDGDRPDGPLLLDNDGDIVGTTRSGGSKDAGTVYAFTPPPGAGTVKPVLRYAFKGGSSDGSTPAFGVIASGDTLLYGTTLGGGNTGTGTVFELMLDGSKWNKVPVWKFAGDGSEGRGPTGVVLGTGDALYGVTAEGTSNGYGSVYKLVPPSSGPTWMLRTIYKFSGNDGAFPNPIMIGKGKVIYGTTQSGGDPDCNCGTVFKLKE